MKTVYGIRITKSDGTVFINNAIFRSRAQAEAEAEHQAYAFPEEIYEIVSFFLL